MRFVYLYACVSEHSVRNSCFPQNYYNLKKFQCDVINVIQQSNNNNNKYYKHWRAHDLERFRHWCVRALKISWICNISELPTNKCIINLYVINWWHALINCVHVWVSQRALIISLSSLSYEIVLALRIYKHGKIAKLFIISYIFG